VPEKSKIKSANDLRKLLLKTGSSLKETTFRETVLRVGLEDVPYVEVEKGDGETFFHPLDTKKGQI